MAPPQLSALHSNVLLITFTIAQFVDQFGISALIPAITIIEKELDMSFEESQWILSAYSLTFASFLLFAGRCCDVWSAKSVFVSGFAGVGIMGLICGFAKNKIALFVIRALQGIGAAMTIPAAFALIVQTFPNPQKRNIALSLFIGAGALGTVLGLIIGGSIVARASYSWIFWLMALLATPTALLCVFLIPQDHIPPSAKKKLDVPGVAVLTAAAILLVFAFTSSGTRGWGTAFVLCPLIVSLLMFGFFGWWESKTEEERALLPPAVWRIPNFVPLLFVTLMPFFHLQPIMLMKTTIFTTQFNWNPLETALHFLPLGISGGCFSMLLGPYLIRLPPKLPITTGLVCMMTGAFLNAFARHNTDYWRLDFPGFVIGAMGGAMTAVATNTGFMQSSPPEMAGTIAGVFTAVMQLGSALGLAITTAISVGVNNNKGRATGDEYVGYEAAILFIAACLAVVVFLEVVFVRGVKGVGKGGEGEGDVEGGDGGEKAGKGEGGEEGEGESRTVSPSDGGAESGK